MFNWKTIFLKIELNLYKATYLWGRSFFLLILSRFFLHWKKCLHVSIICAWVCLWRSFLYCCRRAEMSTVSLSLSTFCWLGPTIFFGLGLTGLVFGEALKMLATPKVAATSRPSSSSSSSSSLYKILKPFLATPSPKDQGVMLYVYFSRNSDTSENGNGAISTRFCNRMSSFYDCLLRPLFQPLCTLISLLESEVENVSISCENWPIAL